MKRSINIGSAEHPVKINVISLIKLALKIRKLIRQLRRKRRCVSEKYGNGSREEAEK